MGRVTEDNLHMLRSLESTASFYNNKVRDVCFYVRTYKFVYMYVCITCKLEHVMLCVYMVYVYVFVRMYTW
jgi:hypothetical protein